MAGGKLEERAAKDGRMMRLCMVAAEQRHKGSLARIVALKSRGLCGSHKPITPASKQDEPGDPRAPENIEEEHEGDARRQNVMTRSHI